MLFKHLPLPDLIEAWLHPHMHKRRYLSKRRSTPLPITWQLATSRSHDSSSSRTPVKTLRRKLSRHLARRRKETGKICDESRDTQDEARSMSESARIAFAYRASQNFGRVVSHSDPRSSRGVHQAQPNAHSSHSTSQVQHKYSGLSDLVSRLAPVIIEKYDEEALDQERCRLALRHYRSICSNVIVESQYPDRTPHIVITPPPEQDVFDAPYIAQNNQIPFQYLPSLPVPPLCIQTCRMMTLEQWGSMLYHQFPSSGGSASQSTPANRLVFNRSKFTEWVKGTEENRNCFFRRLLIPAITRHLVKASAVTASILAPSFRARYDSAEFLESLENPFRWTDPALAFLSLYRGHPVGVHHVPSPEPFSVPHILIEESFGNDQTIVDGNVAPIQNSADSKSLVVPASKSICVSLDDLEIEEIALDYDSSTFQSSPPKTPIELGRVDYGFFSSWDIGTQLRDADSFPGTQCHPTIGTGPYRDSKALFFIEEEDEDEFI